MIIDDKSGSNKEIQVVNLNHIENKPEEDFINEDDKSLTERIKNIWCALGLIFPESGTKLTEILENEEVEYPSEIINKYCDKEIFLKFARKRIERVQSDCEIKKIYSDHEIIEWYELIKSFVSQIKQIIRNEGVNPTGLSTRSISHINFTTFSKLFDEPYHKYCDPSSIESQNSPVAYLATVFQIALHVEETSQEKKIEDRGKIIKLKDRRPDLFELVLSEETTFNEVKTIIIVNEVLKSGIQKYLNQYSEKDKDIYSIFSKTLYPFYFPINFHYERIRYAFLDKDSSIRDLKKIFDLNECVTDGKLYRGLPLSKEQIEVLTDYNESNLSKYFDAEDLEDLIWYRFFLEKTQINSEDLDSVIELGLSNIVINDYDPTSKKISNLDENNLFFIHKTLCVSRWFEISFKDSFILIYHIFEVLKKTKYDLHH